MRNLDQRTVRGFGQEWAAYDQTALHSDQLSTHFESYFRLFPFESLAANAEGFDLGCGSGRWADLVEQRVGLLHCIDASEQALSVARRRLAGRNGAAFHNASVDHMPLADGSQDFGYSLGVLHHVPDPGAAVEHCVRKLKPGAPFLIYLYYNFENRPRWFRALWRGTDLARRVISRTPFPIRKSLTTAVAALIYWPLASVSKAAEKRGRNVSNIPLSFYRHSSFYTMRTDALDRFGTPLEHRFTKAEMNQMMEQAGLINIVFSDEAPFWVACGRKA